MSEKTFQLITLGQAINTLGLDRESFWKQAQAVEAKLLLQLPSGAVLQYRDAKTPKTGLNRLTNKQLCTDLPLAGKNYFIPDSANLIAISTLPEVACDCVTHLATRHPGQAAASIISIGEAIDDFPLSSCIDKVLCKTAFLRLLLPNNTSVVLSDQSAYLLKEDVERIQSYDTCPYPPGIEDYGAFKPSEYTTRMICEMNTAYHLFRIKNPIDPKDPSSRVLVKDWFDATWNSGEIKKAVDDVLTKATEVVLQGNSGITIGKLTVRDEVKNQHAEGAPDALMLMEQLAQDRGVWTRPKVRNDDSIDFDSQSNLEVGLKKKKVAPIRYIRLIQRVLNPDR